MSQVFCYGMLKNPLIWAMVTRTLPRVTSTATLQGYKVVESGSMRKGNNLVPCEGSSVTGILRPVDDCAEEVYSFGNSYKRVPLTVSTPGGGESAFCYLRREPTEEPSTVVIDDSTLRKPEYKILSASSKEELERLVTTLLGSEWGWEVQGGPVVRGDLLYQAVSRAGVEDDGYID